MADNIAVTAGSGTTIATDDVAGTHYQRVKLVDGTLDGTGAIAGDATNGLDVDVTRSALPSGAATAANQTTAIGHLDGVEGLLTTIDGDTGTLAGAVAGTEVQVDVVGALPAGTNNIGDVDVLTLPNVTVGAALPAGTNNIGDVDIASALPAGTNNIGDVDILSIAAGDNNIGNVDLASAIPAGTNNIGDVDVATIATGAGKTIAYASIDTATSGDNTIVAADASNKIKVISYVLVSTSALAVRWKSGANNKSGAMALAANGGISIAGSPISPLLETAVNEALILNLSAATQVSGHIAYWKEA